MNETFSAPHQNDSFFVAELDLCEVRLFNQADLLWLILIPKKENVIELIDLEDKDQQILLTEINLMSRLLKENFPCDKLNIATLGNVVPQLHIHIIARRFNDAYFPKSPFGVSKISYSAVEKDQLIQTLRALIR